MNLHLIAEKLNELEGLSLLEESINLYEKFRIKDGHNEGEDSLLFQWGIFDWGEGEHFEIDVTRQLAPDNRDEIQHLHTTLFFETSDELRAIEEGNIWCHSPKDSSTLMSNFKESKAFEACVILQPIKQVVEVEYV